jgi:hypothetical protein
VPADAEPGVYTLKVKLKCQGLEEEVVLDALVDVRQTVLQQRKDFPVTHWWNPDCIYDWYKLEPFGDDFFRIVRSIMQNMLDHGSNVIYVPILNIRREIMKRPPQLLIVKEAEPGIYEFDWSLLRKFVHLAKEIGFEFYEWTHLWAYSHNNAKAVSAGTPTRIYTERNGRMELLFPPDLDATGGVFANYTDYLKKGIPHWVYYCMGPTGPYINRFFDTPLIKVRMQGLIFYKLQTLGFLHWGYNYWYILHNGFDMESQQMIDPFTDGSAGVKTPHGDGFVVYPGHEGPIDSIRWEVFAEAMQDYALLQTLGVNPDEEWLKPIMNYAEFPKSEQWFREAIQRLLL